MIHHCSIHACNFCVPTWYLPRSSLAVACFRHFMIYHCSSNFCVQTIIKRACSLVFRPNPLSWDSWDWVWDQYISPVEGVGLKSIEHWSTRFWVLVEWTSFPGLSHFYSVFTFIHGSERVTEKKDDLESFCMWVDWHGEGGAHIQIARTRTKSGFLASQEE